MKAQLSEVIGQYISVRLDTEGAIKLLEILRRSLDKGGEDVDDTIRMIKNFEAFYEFMRKKFKEYLTPKKNLSDMIKGKVLVDKIKLVKENDRKYVVIVFDRSVPKDAILKALNELGYTVEES